MRKQGLKPEGRVASRITWGVSRCELPKYWRDGARASPAANTRSGNTSRLERKPALHQLPHFRAVQAATHCVDHQDMRSGAGAVEAEPVRNVYLARQGDRVDLQVPHTKKTLAVQDAAEFHKHQLSRRWVGKTCRRAIARFKLDDLGILRYMIELKKIECASDSVQRHQPFLGQSSIADLGAEEPERNV